MLISATPETCPDFSYNGAGVDWAAHNKGVTPVFFIDKMTRTNVDGTETEIEIEYVTIVIAGDDLTEATHPVDAQIRERFADQYKAWKEGREFLTGTPIVECPFITARQAAFLQTLNIFTAEALSELSDYNVGNVPDGRVLRDKASRFLKASLAANIADEYAKTKARLAKAEAQIAELTQRKRKEMPAEQRAKMSATQKAYRDRVKAALAEAAGTNVAPEPAGQNCPPEPTCSNEQGEPRTGLDG